MSDSHRSPSPAHDLAPGALESRTAALLARIAPVAPDARLRASVLARYDSATATGELARDFAAPRGWRVFGVGVAAAAALLLAVGTFWVSSSAGRLASTTPRGVVLVDDPSLLDPHALGLAGSDDLARLDPDATNTAGGAR